jgi:hypothetical protein
MNNIRPTLNDLFRQTRVRPRLVKEDDVRNIMAQSDMTGAGIQKMIDSPRSRFQRGGALLATAMFIGLAVYQLTVNSGQAGATMVKSHDSASYRVDVIRRNPERSDSVALLIPPANADTGQDGEFDPSVPASIEGIHLFTLTPAEFTRIGAVRDSDGITYYNYDKEGRIGKTWVGAGGISWSRISLNEVAPGIQPSPFYPVLITDDMGMYRMARYEEEDIDSALAARMKKVEAADSPEFHKLSKELSHKARVWLAQRFNTLVPIIIRTGVPYTSADSAAKRWRPDVILWYDPTPGFLAALPDHMRSKLVPELAAAEEGDAVAEASPRTTLRQRDNNQQRRATLPHRVAKDTAQSGSGAGVTIVDSDRNDRPSPTSDDVVTGGQYLDAWRTTDGAIISSMLFPNPAHQETTLMLRLSAPRLLTVTLHDLYGRKLREIMQFEMTSPGERNVAIDLSGIREGIYLISVVTEKRERIVQRVVVVR